ncbi:MAG: hypothetical protein JNM52_08125, partial [Betaproteobacteria bacterium]|nr:hypothetical protein [Betaproteobacteria bacterium]
NQFMQNPVMIEVARRNAPADLVTHQVYEIPVERKYPLLKHLISSRNMQQVLVFARKKIDTDRLSRKLLRDGLTAAAIHSDRSQQERTQALEDFKQGKSRILVATEVAARGLDIDQLPFVINYELPHTPEDYVHRIGRTGRAGCPGEAISLVSPDESSFLTDIEKLLKRKIDRLPVPALADERPASRSDGGGSERSPRRESWREERIARESGYPRPPRESSPSARSSPSDPNFDFNKPYEPAAPVATVAAEAKPAELQRPTARTVGVLLNRSLRDKSKAQEPL